MQSVQGSTRNFDDARGPSDNEVEQGNTYWSTEDGSYICQLTPDGTVLSAWDLPPPNPAGLYVATNANPYDPEDMSDRVINNQDSGVPAWDQSAARGTYSYGDPSFTTDTASQGNPSTLYGSATSDYPAWGPEVEGPDTQNYNNMYPSSVTEESNSAYTTTEGDKLNPDPDIITSSITATGAGRKTQREFESVVEKVRRQNREAQQRCRHRKKSAIINSGVADPEAERTRRGKQTDWLRASRARAKAEESKIC